MNRAWTRMGGRACTGATVVIIAAMTLTVGAGPAAGVAAVPRPAAAPYWGSFVIDGDPAAGLTGSLTMPGGFPAFGPIDSTSNGLAAAGDGASVFLNASTPVGQLFGSSVNQQLLTLGAAPDGGTSATGFRLGDGTPTSDWAFVLGDIDADQVRVIGLTTQDGISVPPADLGFQGTFNYCTGVPLPPACGGQSSSDAPSWDPATGILTGQGSDTGGASAWFAPTVPLTSLSFAFTTTTPGQTFQTWFVSDTRTLSGTVTADGVGVGGAQVGLGQLPDSGVDSTTSAADGSYHFGPLVPGTYQVDATPPTGYLPAGPTTRTADLLDGDASGVDFAVAAAIYRAGGRVTAGGQGVADVQINCYGADQSLIGTGRTDGSGNYLCPLLSPGDYQVVSVPPPGFVPIPEAPVDFTVVDTDISGLDFALVPGYPVTGLVVDALGTPLPDVPVDLVGPTGGIFASTTGPDGRFSFPEVIAGEYTIVVRPAGGAEISVPVTVPVAGGEVPAIVVAPEVTTSSSTEPAASTPSSTTVTPTTAPASTTAPAPMTTELSTTAAPPDGSLPPSYPTPTTRELAATGSHAPELVPLAAVLVLSGGAMLLVARRRPVRNSIATKRPAGSSRQPRRPGPTTR